MKIDRRAWIEINLENLENNVQEIRKKLKPKTDIIAVIKANAYGHGDILIAKKLNELGIRNFAVATLEEGINLRKNNIKGDILILGYIPITKTQKIYNNDLTQTIIYLEYAYEINKELQKTNKKIKVNIKINTGMNRIGIKYNEENKIEEIFKLNNLTTTGIFSHLAVANEVIQENIEYTKEQILKFEKCINSLKLKGYEVGKTHIQSSYGMLNYSKNVFDYVRVGLFLYGIQDKKREDFNLKPVLTLKARIECINEIEENETVGYGRTYIAKNNEKIAVVSIGYADGVPRNLSNKNAKVIVNGEYGNIIGKICMDQLMIKIPSNVEVKAGDTVTLIGKENEKEINVNDIAKLSDSISYEILSRLGARLDRILV